MATVITKRRLPPTPCPAMHLTAVSDSQSVPSHPVCPPLAPVVSPPLPIPVPPSVTTNEPVPARLPLRTALTPGTSHDKPLLTVPPRPPAVITARRVPPAPWPVRHLTAVSDSQSVPSHPECPSRPLAVCLATPRPDPCTVIDAEPVPPPLARRTMLPTDTSSDTAIVKLPPLCPTVITARRVPRTPCPAVHLTAVSDSQSVPSHPECPSRPRAVAAASPSPPPCIRRAAAPSTL